MPTPSTYTVQSLKSDPTGRIVQASITCTIGDGGPLHFNPPDFDLATIDAFVPGPYEGGALSGLFIGTPILGSDGSELGPTFDWFPTIDQDVASGGTILQDGPNGPDVVQLDGAGHVNVSATVSIDLSAPAVTINGSPVASPTFNDNVIPATFNTNADYDLPSAPNPTASLQVFINSEAVPKAGCDRLLVQGVDYLLTTGAHGANTRIHYLVTPTATNTIRAFYRS